MSQPTVPQATLSARELAALKACSPTLRHTPRGFVTAPVARPCAPISAPLVRSLVASGLLAWGNPGHRFVTLTAAGGQALGGRA